MPARRPTYTASADRRCRRAVTFALLLLCLPGARSLAQPASPVRAKHVVLISIDGLKPSYYLPGPSRRTKTPALDALRARGSWAEGVVGVYPSLTYPSHASIATGVMPVRHGIVQNTRFDPANGSAQWIFENSALKVPALWDAAKAAGLTTAGVSWPVTVGARMDYLFPETNQAPRDTTWLDLARRQSTPGLIDAIVARLGGLGPRDNLDYFKRDTFAAAAAALILEEHRPNLMLVHLVEADTAQHEFGPDSPEAIAAVEHVDVRVGEIVAAVQEAGIAADTAFVITGDHGFYRVHSVLQPNAVLRDAGLLHTDGNGRVTSWQAVAHRAAIRIKDPSDTALARKVEDLFRSLADGRYRGIFRVVGRDEIARLGGDPDVLLIIEPIEGYTAGMGVDGGFVVAASRHGDHGFLPTEPRMYTGLIASGAGVRQGIAVPLTRQIDIAPTVARLLGFELTEADGIPLVGILGTGTAARRQAAGY